jgi:broad specificity phosphatase PhoE
MSSIIFEQRDAHPGGVVVLVSHQAPIWIARQSFERPGVPWLAKVRCTQASITTLRFDGAMYRGHEYWAPPM